MSNAAEPEVLEPEVILPGQEPSETQEVRQPRGVNPALAGLIIDLVNIPLGGLPGFVAGAAIGYWAASTHNLGPVHKALIAIAVGWYCGLPLPRTFPAATLAGLILYFGIRSRR